MGYTLRPRNKNVDSFEVGGFSWPWMLDAGVGLPIGHAPGIEPASFIYATRPDGLCVMYNDGARVSAKEAKQMAQLARWIAQRQELIHSQFDKLPEERKRQMLDSSLEAKIYRPPVRKDFVQKCRDFADFAEKSGGFRVF